MKTTLSLVLLTMFCESRTVADITKNFPPPALSRPSQPAFRERRRVVIATGVPKTFTGVWNTGTEFIGSHRVPVFMYTLSVELEGVTQPSKVYLQYHANTPEGPFPEKISIFVRHCVAEKRRVSFFGFEGMPRPIFSRIENVIGGQFVDFLIPD